ncbi:MAG: hypothetical protein FJX76_11275 [Armatimonadetes bacterium]|nr:hypothetical protein [Armatimonadota bacterium]
MRTLSVENGNVATLLPPAPVGVAESRTGTPCEQPRDTYHVVSPFLNCDASAASLGPARLTVADLVDAAPAKDLTALQRITMAGLTGLAILGSGIFGAVTSAPKLELHEASISQTFSLTSDKGLMRSNAMMAFLGEAATNPRAQETPVAIARESVDRLAMQQPPKKITVFGQELGHTQDNIPGVKWVKYKGTYNGQGYVIEYPEGWRVTKIFNGVAVIDPNDTETMAVFMWRNGQGAMSPSGLIQTVLREASASNVRFNSQRPSGPSQTPIGPLYTLNADVSYTAPDGSRLRAEFTSAVANAPNSYVPFWNGNLVACQTAQADFNEDIPILRHVTNSFQQE